MRCTRDDARWNPVCVLPDDVKTRKCTMLRPFETDHNNRNRGAESREFCFYRRYLPSSPIQFPLVYGVDPPRDGITCKPSVESTQTAYFLFIFHPAGSFQSLCLCARDILIRAEKTYLKFFHLLYASQSYSARGESPSCPPTKPPTPPKPPTSGAHYQNISHYVGTESQVITPARGSF